MVWISGVWTGVRGRETESRAVATIFGSSLHVGPVAARGAQCNGVLTNWSE